MEFIITKADLLSELAIARGAAEKKTTIPILANVLIEAREDCVTLTASDLELALRCTCRARVKTPGAGTVPARKLLDYIRALPEGDISVKWKDTWANLTSGRNRTRIAGMSQESFPNLPEIPAPIAEIPALTLVSMIGRVASSISAEESRFTLNGALLQFGGGQMTLVATDGHRLAFTQGSVGSATEQAPFKAVIPKRAMGEIAKICSDAGANANLTLASDENHLFFQAGERLLVTRKVAGHFPDYERVLPKGSQYCALIEREAMTAAFERVGQFSDETSRAVRVQFLAGELRIFASCVESGESEESVSCEYAGPDIEIGFNGRYLLDFLSVGAGNQVAFCVTDAKSAGELRPAGEATGDQYRYVVMPMRV